MDSKDRVIHTGDIFEFVLPIETRLLGWINAVLVSPTFNPPLHLNFIGHLSKSSIYLRPIVITSGINWWSYETSNGPDIRIYAIGWK